MEESQIHRLWKPVEFNENWRNSDTSILDDLSSSWFARRKRLLIDGTSFQAFLERLKREHAIETGVIERLYDIDRGVTETLIQHGFIEGLLSHGDANIPTDQLMDHLRDHLQAMDFVFELIKEQRPLSISYIKEIHQLVTRSQLTAEGRDQFGTRTRIPLLKGKFKERDNNPTRPDGIKIFYCPPLHVESEMNRLVQIYHGLEEQRLHPVIIAAWVHHAFTTIHPFQDGNGRVVRLIASMILIKHDLFPMTVLRQEAKLNYISSLEKADSGDPNELVKFFCKVQKRQVERAIEANETVAESLSMVTNLVSDRLETRLKSAVAAREAAEARKRWIANQQVQVFELIRNSAEELFSSLRSSSTTMNDIKEQHAIPFGFGHFASEFLLDDRYWMHNDMLPSKGMPAASIGYFVTWPDIRVSFSFGIVVFHRFEDDSVMVLVPTCDIRVEGAKHILFDIPIHLFSILDDNLHPKRRNIKKHLEESLSIALAHLVNSLG